MIALTVAGTDRTKLIASGSLQMSNVLTSQADTCSFRVDAYGSQDFAPVVGQEVIVTKDGTRLFGGRITEVEGQYDKLDLVGYVVRCSDYTRDLDQRLVVENYEGLTVAQIIGHIATNYLDAAFSTAGVDCDIPIDYIGFKYEYPSACLKQLAELVGFDWYVDPNRVIYFFSKQNNPAPFDLADDTGVYLYNTLVIRRDITPVRNTIYVLGGEYLGNTVTAAYVSEVNQKHFLLPYRFSDLKVMVTGHQAGFGLDNIDDPTNSDALYNFTEKLVKFRSDRMRDGKAVRISGRPYLRVLVKVRDSDSIAAFSADEGNSGVYEYKIVDESIISKEAARQRGRAELLAYAQTLSQGSFSTNSDGLRAGMRIRVQSTIRGLDEYFVINRVDASPEDHGETMRYRVSLVTTKTFDYVQLLQALLAQKTKSIDFPEDTVQETVENVDDTMGFSDVVTAQVPDWPVRFVWGQQVPSSFDRSLNWTGGKWE